MQKQKPGKKTSQILEPQGHWSKSMSRKRRKSFIALWLIAASLFTSANAQETRMRKPEPLMIQEQGSFAVGGAVTTAPGTFDPIKQGAYNPAGTDPAGQTLHGDHAYVFYQVPVNARKLPLVFWHGHGQSAKTWETTPDGREGFQNIFLRRRFPVYLIDQPRRGRAARGTQPINIAATPDEQLWFGIFRLGTWPDFYLGVQFSRDTEALNQFFRQMVPNTGPYDAQVNTDAVSALFNKIGPGILVTHSQSGGLGWRTAIKNTNVRAIVSYEPGFDFPFPEGDVPPAMTLGGRALSAITVSRSDFMLLTKIPIVIYYGDNIPDKPSSNPGQEQWRIFFEMAKKWRDVVNRNGGDVTLVHLPEIGIRGNTHFPMSDLNNVQIADQMSKFVSEKKLD
jgi:pimeloyl-ACP methyl ester carboxylesterase